jgi:proteic killer suppression protein
VRIATIKHKGLRRYVQTGDTSGVLAGREARLRQVLSAIRAAKNLKALASFPGLRLHMLRGQRKGHWSLTVTGNWRLTFLEKDDALFDVDLEDYH